MTASPHRPIPLPKGFLTHPIAHRALHDKTSGRPENSRGAIEAAIAQGFGIEIDLQLSKDEHAMVFHDYELSRLTGREGVIQHSSLSELSQITLLHSDETVPHFPEILELVAGRVPLLVELKDQDGMMGPETGPLEKATAKALEGYTGDVAVMSFNPQSVATFGALNTGIPLGLTTEYFPKTSYPNLPDSTRTHLRNMSDFGRVNASFISHDAHDLDSPRVSALKARNIPVLCWTIRSKEDEIAARKIADNITFEGYLA